MRSLQSQNFSPVPDGRIAYRVARGCRDRHPGRFRADLYRRNLGHVDADLPGASEKVEGSLRFETAVASTRGHMILAPDAFFDGRTFDFS